jgi:hypothetical protein
MSILKRDEFASMLIEALKTNRPKVCTKVLKDISEHELTDGDLKFYNRLKTLIKKYKYKEALKILGTNF